MQYLDLNDVRPGMVVGLDVRDTRGRLLLEAGNVLTDQLLRVLRDHQIEEVPVAPMYMPDKNPGNGTDAVGSGSHVDAKFRLCDARHPLIHELRRLCRERGIRTKGGRDDD